jgi:hypothetical protein
MMKKLAVFIVMALVFTALPVVSAQGGTIQVGQTVEDSLNDATATYQLSLEADQSVSIALNSDDFDAYLEVQDKAGNQLASDDDSGTDYNSALIFTAPSTGVYNIVARAYDGNATGAYTLIVDSVTVVALTYGAPVAVDVENDIHTFTFQGTEGDFVNIYTDNPDVDVRLTLMGPDNNQIASDDDGGEGYASYIRAAELPTTGTYTVQMEPVLDAIGTLNLTVEQTQLTILGAEPYVVSLGGDNPSNDVVGFEAVSGQNYRMTVSSDVVGSAYIQIEQGDFNWISVSFYNVLENSFVFASTTDGVLKIEIDDSSGSGATYTVTVAPAS